MRQLLDLTKEESDGYLRLEQSGAQLTYLVERAARSLLSRFSTLDFSAIKQNLATTHNKILGYPFNSSNYILLSAEFSELFRLPFPRQPFHPFGCETIELC